MTQANWTECCNCDVDEQNEELEALNAIALAVGSTLHIDEVLSNFLINLAKLVPYDSASIALWQHNRLRLVAQRGLPGDDVTQAGETAMNEGQRWQRVMERDDALIFPDVRLESSWIAAPGLEYIRCWMAVPLICKGRSIGLLNLDKAEPGFYTPAHAKRVRSVAQQVAIAIENAQLYSELETRVGERTAELQAQMYQTEAILRNVADGIMFTDQDHQGWAALRRGDYHHADPRRGRDRASLRDGTARRNRSTQPGSGQDALRRGRGTRPG